MIALNPNADDRRADGWQSCRNDGEPIVVPMDPVRREGKAVDKHRTGYECQREDAVAENLESMVETAELHGGPAVIIDLGLHLFVCDRSGQGGQSRWIDTTGGTADRLPRP